jgi:hypothetical protein
MRMRWTFHRRLFVALIIVVVLGVSSAVVLAGSLHGGPHAGAPTGGQPPSGKRRNTAGHDTTATTRPLAPTSTRQVPKSAIQEKIDAERVPGRHRRRLADRRSGA